MHYEEEESNELVQKLLQLEEIDVNIKNRMGQPVLFYAVHFNRLQVISWLKQKGVDLYATDRCANNVLHYANSVATLTLLIEWMKQSKPADSPPNYLELLVNAPNQQGNTPLHCAYAFTFSTSQLMVVDILKAHGADDNVKNKHGNTPPTLLFAIKRKLLPFYPTDEEAPLCSGLLIGRVHFTSPADLSFPS